MRISGEISDYKGNPSIKLKEWGGLILVVTYRMKVGGMNIGSCLSRETSNEEKSNKEMVAN